MTSLQAAVISFDRTAACMTQGTLSSHLLYFPSPTSSALSPLSTTEHYLLTFVLYFCFRHSTSPPLSLMPRRCILVAVAAAAAWACGAANPLPASPPQPSILYTLGPCRP